MLDDGHETRALDAVASALATVPFYVKQGLALPGAGSLDDRLGALPLLTRERVRPTLPKAWFPEGRDAKTELANGAVVVIETGAAENRVRVLFSPREWREQERRALATHPRAASTFAGEMGSHADAVLWVPERGTGSCGAGDPSYEERIEGARLHLNSRQDPTFWTEAVMTRMLDELALHETAALYADPYYLDVLARHAAILNRRLDVRGFIATTRARRTVAQHEALRRVFPGVVIDLFAAREVGPLFVEGEDGDLHHVPHATHVELLPAKVETPGATDVALLVVTTLERSVQPFVRYVLGDLAQVRKDRPGRFTTVPSLRTVEGTIDDAFVRPDGALVTPGAIDRAIGTLARSYQAVQTEAATVEVEVVGGSPADVAAAIAPLCTGMTVSGRTATALAVEPNGKYRSTRRRIAFDFRSAFAVGEETAR